MSKRLKRDDGTPNTYLRKESYARKSYGNRKVPARPKASRAAAKPSRRAATSLAKAYNIKKVPRISTKKGELKAWDTCGLMQLMSHDHLLTAPAQVPIVKALIDGTPAETGCLNAPPAGAGPSDRDGREISATHIFVQGSIIGAYIDQDQPITGADSNLPAGWFVALVRDKQCNGEAPKASDVFKNLSQLGELTSHPVRNPANLQRFDVLATASGILPITVAGEAPTGVSTYTTIMENRQFSLSSKLNFKQQFTSDLHGISGLSDNGLFLIALCGTTDYGGRPYIDFDARFRFRG